MTASEAVQTALDAITRSEASVRAWARIDADAARAAAADQDAAPATGHLALRGITVGVKDIIDAAGMPTVAGFAPYALRAPATDDGAVVARLRASGATILGKTVTTQFAVGDPSITRNPWNLGRTPGGSSSGSAAAVAAGHVDIGIGSQTTGSTLRPAAYCGAYGLKPSFNWVSRRGMIPLAPSLDHVGLIAGNLTIIQAAFDAIADVAGGRERREQPEIRTPRLAVWREPLAFVDEEIRQRFNDVLNGFVDAGAAAIDAPAFVPYERIFAVQQVIFACEAAAVHSASLAQHRDAYAPKVRSFVEVGSAIPAHMYVRAQALRSELRAAAAAAWDGFDAVVLPTAGSPAPTPETTGDTTLQAAATLFGFPAISLPAGLSSDGMPWGIQVIAPALGTTRRLLAVARWLDQLLPKLPRPTVEAIPSAPR